MHKNLTFNMTRQVRTETANLDTHPVIFYIKTFQDLSFQEKKKALFSHSIKNITEYIYDNKKD